MRRNSHGGGPGGWFVLVLATGVVLAQDRPGARQASSAPEGQAQTESAPARTDPAQGKAAEGTPAGTNEAQGRIDEAQAPTEEEAKLLSTPGSKALGMSILGNQEAPTSLVIVPWKSSELGDSRGIPTMLDDSKEPVDKDVFMRALRYYEIRSDTKP